MIPHPFPKVLLICGVATAVALRVAILLNPTLGVLDSDEAVPGLMAMDALEGNLEVFYWGQPYGGTLEVFLIASLFAIFGPLTIVLKMVPILLSGVCALLLFRIGRRTVGKPAAHIAALVFLLWPGFFVWLSTKERGFYWICMVMGLAVILIGLRLLERPSMFEAFILGALLGLGWWNSSQVLYLALPAGIWVVSQKPRLLRMAPLVLAGFLAGASPWLWFNVLNGWPSRWQPLQPESNFFVAHLWGFFWRAFPRAFGITVPYSGEWFLPIVTVPLALVLVAGVGYSWLKRPRGWSLALLAVSMYPLLFATMPPGWVPEPRYVFFIHPMFALLVGGWIARSRQPAVWMISLGVLTLLSVAALFALRSSAPIETRAPDIAAPVNTRPLINTLTRAGADRVFTDYWIAYRITFESRKRIIATPLGGAMRNRSFEKSVEESPNPAYVWVEGSVFDSFLSNRLGDLGIPYRRIVAGGYVVFQTESKVLPIDIWPGY